MRIKKRVLLIDDENDFCFFMKINLERTGGMSVLTAATADKGIMLARRCAPDVIILDINMPGKDGFEALRALKYDGRTMSIPVVMLTAREDDESRRRTSELFTEGYIAKPAGWETVKEKIETVLKRRPEPGVMAGQPKKSLRLDTKRG